VAVGTALATVAATVLPTAGVVAGALTVTQIAQATTALLTALRRFQNQRAQAFDDQLRREALAEQPTLGDVIDNIISRELGFEATFRAKQYARIQAELAPALAIADPKEREKAVRALFERERKYTQMREEAMRVRVMAAVRHYHLEQASPQGAYWKLGENVKKHTIDCLAMANKFWPWSVLHAFQPPVHHGCACSLMGLREAVANGLMTPDQVPNEMHAVAHATDLLQRAANAMRNGLREADVEAYLAGLRLEEARWEERFSKGTSNAGRFRPRVGGDPGAQLLKKLGLGRRGEIMHELLPSARPLAQSDQGKWTWLNGQYVHVPLSHDWKRQIGGQMFRSPAGTTNVLKDGQLISSVDGETRAAVHARVAELVKDSQERAARRTGAPLREGDGPEHVLAMEQRGFVPRRVGPAGPGAWKVAYHNSESGSLVNAVVSKAGKVLHADWDTSPIGEQRAKVSALAPRTFAEHTSDALAWANELKKRYGASLRIGTVRASNEFEDHAGLHEHTGNVWLGKDTVRDINRAGKARAAGKALSDREKRGVWSTYWATAHEIAHAVNPIHPELFKNEDANLEEALAEEMSHPLAIERLKAQGQHDVVEWRRTHPNEMAVRGVYGEQRGALADVLDAAKIVVPEDRQRVIAALKFEVDPAERFRVLGALIHEANPEVSVNQGEKSARIALRNGGEPRPALMLSPGAFPWKGFGKGKHEKYVKAKPPPKLPPVVIGGDVSEPAQQGPIPSFEHIPLELHGRAWGFGDSAVAAKRGDEDWIVKEHHGDRNHVASELLANSLYRLLGIDVPVMGRVATPGAPDFAQVPDTLAEEPELPETHRLSTGVIIRKKNGSVVLIEPRNHYGGYIHTFPKGGLEGGLTPQQNALKELWEETGLHAHIVGVVGDYKGDTGMTRYYLGVQTGGQPTVSDETEAVKTVTMKQAMEMLNKQRDRDILGDVSQQPVPKGQFADVFPPTVPGVAAAFPTPVGKKFEPKEPNDALAAGYMVDALLGNWGFVGSHGDNLRWEGEDKPTRVNHASALEYRENGDPKDFGEVPEEIWSMLYRGQGSGVVALDQDQMRAQARRISRALTGKKIDELVFAAPFRDDATRAHLASTLKQRLAWIRDFGAGKIDLPEPASGAEARGLHEDALKKFPIYPEEHKAISDYLGEPGRKFDKGAADKTPPTNQARSIAKRLDNLLKDTRTSADTYAFIGYPKEAGRGLVGQTIKQRSYTLAHTDQGNAKGKTLVRLTLPGGSRALYMADQAKGQPDLLLPRGARMKFTGVTEDEDGRKVVTALLLPYESPPALPYASSGKKPKAQMSFGTPEKPEPSSAYDTGDRVMVDLGTMGKQKATVLHAEGGKLRLKMDNGSRTWQSPTWVRRLTESHFDLELAEADSHHTGVMVALYPHPSTAKKFALDGGEDPDALHCTLAFLGKKDDLQDPDALKQAVSGWAARTPPLEGVVSGHGLFTAGETPVTYLSPDLPGLPAARDDLVSTLKDSGHPASAEHGYTPHITLDYADRTNDLPEHGGHKLKFKRAVLKIGDENHAFPLAGGA
jgi:ADP-ribose pyrophosphatase YjhB (NUDIX family)/2'-5' RNA ligase